MGYDLVFWNQAPAETRRPDELLAAIADGAVPVAGLRPLPIEAVLAGCVEAFPGAERGGNATGEWIVHDQPDDDWMFELTWSESHLWVTFRGSWPGEAANRLIDVALDFDCRLYDPQTGERFG